jgi:uncharacterized protein YdaU (DUF1376 family)
MNGTDIWMPMFIGDYLSNTIGLRKAEHGSYLLAIFKYWQKGESLSDRELREVCGREFARVSEFFVWEGNKWHHKRVDHELSEARRRVEAAREKAMKGVEARRKAGQI